MTGLVFFVFGVLFFLHSTIDPIEACADSFPNTCRIWKKKGYCTRNGLEDLMMTSCKKTCGKCSGVVTTVPVTVTTTVVPTTSVCIDQLSISCSRWKAQGYCNSSIHRSTMERYCKKSCDLCGPQVCADLLPKCAGWKDKGHCGVKSLRTFMESNCKKSCGICGAKGCADLLPNKCPALVRKGYCTVRSVKTTMEINCKKSCGVC